MSADITILEGACVRVQCAHKNDNGDQCQETIEVELLEPETTETLDESATYYAEQEGWADGIYCPDCCEAYHQAAKDEARAELQAEHYDRVDREEDAK